MFFKLFLLCVILNIDLTFQQNNPCAANDGILFHPLPGDSTKFIQCTHGAMFIRDCPSPLVWNNLKFHCEFPTEVSSGSNQVINPPVARLPSDKTKKAIVKERSIQKLVPPPVQTLRVQPSFSPVPRVRTRQENSVMQPAQNRQSLSNQGTMQMQQQPTPNRQSLSNQGTMQMQQQPTQNRQSLSNQGTMQVQQQPLNMVQSEFDDSSIEGSLQSLATMNEPSSNVNFVSQMQKLPTEDGSSNVRPVERPTMQQTKLPMKQTGMQTDMRPNMQTDMRPNMQTDMRPNMQTDMRPNMQTDMRPNMQTDMQTLQQQRPVQPQRLPIPASKRPIQRPSNDRVFENSAQTFQNNVPLPVTEMPIARPLPDDRFMDEVPVGFQNPQTQQPSMTTPKKIKAQQVIPVNNCLLISCDPGFDCVTKDNCQDCNPLCNPRNNVVLSRLVPITCSNVNCPAGFSCGMNNNNLLCFV